jgi:RNA polymerase sigma-70 factor (ECF subfamily)
MKEAMAVMLSEIELVRAAQDGDVASLGILLERHRAPLHATALRLLGHGEEAKDAVQDAFLIALRTIDQVRDPEAIGGWLRTVLRNVCLRNLKKSKEVMVPDESAWPLEQQFMESSVEEIIDGLALRDWVWTALSELPEALRVTAILRYFGSYPSYEEISAILGVPVGTVKSRLNQVKAKLADALLKAAGLAHDETRKLAEYHACFFAEFAEAFNRGELSDDHLSTFSEDVVGVIGKWSFRGRKMLTEGSREDMEAGVKMHPTNVLASKGIAICEYAWENPPEAPLHCPPAMSQVSFLTGEQVHRMRVYHAPRPQGAQQGDTEEAPVKGQR